MTTDWNTAFGALPSTELDKLAVLRVMECANGVLQHMYRDNDPEALSVEETRRAMTFSMSSIKKMQIDLESESITFADDTILLMKEVRELYLEGVKRNNDEAYTKFLIASLACLKACGMERLQVAHDKLFNDCYEMPPYAWGFGMSYIRGFLANQDVLN